MKEIINQYEVTEKMYIQWILEAKKEGKRLVFTIIWIIMFVACLVASAVSNWGYFFILMAIYSGYMILPRDYIVGKRMFRKMHFATGGSTWKRTVTVTEDEIVVNDGQTVTTVRTSDIVKVRQDPEKIRVKMNGNRSVRLYKDSFIEGTAEECLHVLKA
ncbi:MAG: hypothetical protein MJ142_04805 [Clostridia bacterium]|nr:hypothetical protein [Clostridia bacterium]